MRTIISGQAFDIERADVERVASAAQPEVVRRHFVEIAGLRYPVKQVLALATGLERNAFTTQQASAALRRLGLRVGMVGAAGAAGARASEAALPYGAEEEQPWWARDPAALEPYMGKWVALDDRAVVFSGDSPEEVIAWLRERHLRAHSMLRVGIETPDLAGIDLVWP